MKEITKMKKTYLVPFEAEEKVWNTLVARVEADSKEEAFTKVQKSIKESNPLRDFNAEWNGINTVTSECIETIKYGIGEDYNSTIDDVTEADERIKCEIELTAFDIANKEKDELYRMVKEKFTKVGLLLDIQEMELIPIKIEEHFVTYDAIPVDYKRTWSNGEISIHRNNEMITPLHESLLLMNENIMSKSCDYNRSTAIVLPKSFNIKRIDKRMKELKTDVVNFRDKYYIVGVYDGGYALWECEV